MIDKQASGPRQRLLESDLSRLRMAAWFERCALASAAACVGVGRGERLAPEARGCLRRWPTRSIGRGPADNVAWINKVAARLGLVPDQGGPGPATPRDQAR